MNPDMNPADTTPQKAEQKPAKKAKPILPIPRERIAHQVQRSPFLDWVIILAAAVVIAIVLVGVGVSVYLGTGTRLSAPAADAPRSSALPLNQAALDKVLTSFDSKSSERAALRTGYTAPRDPSLP